jgi:hypothetical protein
MQERASQAVKNLKISELQVQFNKLIEESKTAKCDIRCEVGALCSD